MVEDSIDSVVGSVKLMVDIVNDMGDHSNSLEDSVGPEECSMEIREAMGDPQKGCGGTQGKLGLSTRRVGQCPRMAV